MNARVINNEYETRLLDVVGLCAYISMGRNRATQFAENVGAKRKIGKRTLYDKKILDRALDELVEY